MSSEHVLKTNLLSKIGKTEKNQTLFCVFAFLSIITMIIIFLFSSQKAEYSAALSNEVGSIVENLLSPFKWILRDGGVLWVKSHIRKIAHFVGYTLLGSFLLGALLNTKIKRLILKISISASIGLFYSITDEFHQLFVPGRSGQISDVLLDFSGVSFGILICISIYKLICKKSQKTKNKKTNINP